MRKILLFIIFILSISTVLYAGEWQMRFNPQTQRGDWVRGDAPTFSDLTVSNNLTVSVITFPDGTTQNTASTGGGGGITSLSLDGDTGTAEDLTSGDTILVAGGTNINTVVSATDTVTVNLDDDVDTNGKLRGNQVIADGSGTHPSVASGYVELYVYDDGGTDTGRILPYTGSTYIPLAIGDWNGGSPNIYLANGGNVGIAKKPGSYGLDVAGNFNTDGTATVGAITIPNTDGTTGQVLKTNGSGTLTWQPDTTGGSGSSLWYDTGISVELTTSVATRDVSISNSLTVSEDVYVLGDGDFTGTVTGSNLSGVNTGDQDLSTYLTKTGTENYLRKSDASGIPVDSVAYDDGTNVGIGTASPSSKLQVGTTGEYGLANGITFEDGTAGIYKEDAISFAINPGSFSRRLLLDVTSAAIRPGTGGGLSLGTGSRKFANLYTTMITSTATAVGIGTDSPLSKLDVVGDIFTDQYLRLATNTFLGVGVAGKGNMATGATYCTGVGNTALNSLTTGDSNTAVGFRALRDTTSGVANSAFGRDVLMFNTTGYQNNAMGNSALYENRTGVYNNAMGNSALGSNYSGSYNNAMGGGALQYITTGYRNIGIGFGAGRFASDGTTKNETGYSSIFIGTHSRANADGEANQIVIGGEDTGGSPTIGLGSNTVVLGNNDIVTTALKGNVGIGTDSPNNKLEVDGLISFDDTLSNVALGTDALDRVTTGGYNVALGVGAGEYITEGHSNMAIGKNSLGGTTVGTFNTGVGYQTAIGNTEGEKNTAIGSRALRYNQVGDENIGIGYLVMEGNSGNSYSNNVGIGSYAGREITTGSNNTFIGGYSLGNIQDGSSNVALGYTAGRSLTSGSYNIFLGRQAGYRQTTNSNLLIVDNQTRADISTEATNAILYGTMAATPADQTLKVNAELEVSECLSVSGTATISGILSQSGTVYYATVDSQGELGRSAQTYPIAGGGGSTSPGGSDTQIQYNNSSSFGGISELTYSGSTVYYKGTEIGSGGGTTYTGGSNITVDSTVINLDDNVYLAGELSANGDLTVGGTLFAAPLGYIKDLTVSYTSTTSVTYGPGAIHCKDKVFYHNGYTTDTISNFSDGGFTYGYLDYSASTATNPVFIDSTTEPVYSDSLQGLYNGDDRCVGAYYCDSSSTILFFDSYSYGGVEMYRWDLWYTLGDAQNPTGAWLTPNIEEGPKYLPIGAVGAFIYAKSADSILCGVYVTTKELADEESNDFQSNLISQMGYSEVRVANFIPCGASRKYRVSGDDDDDNGELDIKIGGYGIRR